MSGIYFVACSNDFLILNVNGNEGVVYKFDEIVEKCSPFSSVVVEVEEGDCVE